MIHLWHIEESLMICCIDYAWLYMLADEFYIESEFMKKWRQRRIPSIRGGGPASLKANRHSEESLGNTFYSMQEGILRLESKGTYSS
jgi:hypothetical protein